MIKKLAILFLLFSVLGAELKQTYALEPLIIGADAMGRGGAYLGSDDSNHYVFQNYSFLAEKVTPRVSLTAFKLISEIDYLSASYSQDNFSLGFLTIQERGGYMRDKRNNVIGGQIGFNDTTLYGAYGFQYTDFKLGVRGKYFHKSFSQIDESAWGLSFDLTGAYEYKDYLTFGAELNNLIGTTLQWNDGIEEKFPLTLGIGAKFKAFGAGALWEDWFNQRVDFYADINVDDRNSFLHAGAEYYPAQWVALRAGLSQAYDMQDNQDAKITKFVAGAGFNWSGFYFDYAYNPGDDVAANLTHFFTIAYRFHAAEEKEIVPTPAPVVVIAEPTELRNRMFNDISALPLEDQLAIEDIGFLGFMIGYGDGLFEPEQPLTRRELMLIVTRLLEKEGRYQPGSARYFPDIAQNYAADMNKASGFGMLRGYPDGQAKVQIPVRRDEAAGVFARYADISGQTLPEDAQTYVDVPRRHWAYRDINLTRYYNLTQGIGKDLYRPEEYLLRRDAARVLSRIGFVQELREVLPPIVGFNYSAGVSEDIVYIEPDYSYTTTIRLPDSSAPLGTRPEPIVILEQAEPVTDEPTDEIEYFEELGDNGVFRGYIIHRETPEDVDTRLPSAEQPVEVSAEEEVDVQAIEEELKRITAQEEEKRRQAEQDLIRELEAEISAMPEKTEAERIRELEEEIDTLDFNYQLLGY